MNFLSALKNTVFKLKSLKKFSPSVLSLAKMAYDLVSLPSFSHPLQKLVTSEQGLKIK
jgi:hypothetical protein